MSQDSPHVVWSSLFSDWFSYGWKHAKSSVKMWILILLFSLFLSIVSYFVQHALPGAQFTEIFSTQQGLWEKIKALETELRDQWMNKELIEEEIKRSEYWSQLQQLPSLGSKFYLFLVLSTFIARTISILINMWLMTSWLFYYQHQKVNLAQYFTKISQFWKLLWAMILYLLMIYIWVLLLIIPGIYLFVRFSMYNLIILDKGFGPIDALGYSWKITNNKFWQLLRAYICVGIIGMLWFLALIVGSFWALPTGILTRIKIYHRLSDEYERWAHTLEKTKHIKTTPKNILNAKETVKKKTIVGKSVVKKNSSVSKNKAQSKAMTV